ncbi:MAG TPA: hypothetical protein VL986_10170 [Terracidiphilus sp.]|nr:hypothetical protein [Terracidiphilus sp.]
MDEIERAERLSAIQRLVEKAEKAYDEMYEVYSRHDIDRCYRDAKDYYTDAIGLAHRLDLNDEADKFQKRLWHIKEVFFSQFAGQGTSPTNASS